MLLVSRILFFVLIITTALVIEVTMLSRLDLPGATPGLVTVTVISIGMAAGPQTGAIVGFAAGLLADISPPAAGLVGIGAVVLCLVGYTAGLAGRLENRAVLVTLAQTSGLGAAAVLGQAALSGLAGDPRVRWEDVVGFTCSAALYAVFLGVFVVPAVAAMYARLTPADPMSRSL